MFAVSVSAQLYLLEVFQSNYFALSVSAQLCLLLVFQSNYFALSVSAQLCLLEVFQSNYFTQPNYDFSECFSPIMFSLHTIIILLLFSSFNDALSISRGAVDRKNCDDKCDQLVLCLYRKQVHQKALKISPPDSNLSRIDRNRTLTLNILNTQYFITTFPQ
jgi:hypothetical protein